MGVDNSTWWKISYTCQNQSKYEGVTLTVELDNIERMLMQIELTVIAGDQESYKISVWAWSKKDAYLKSQYNR